MSDVLFIVSSDMRSATLRAKELGLSASQWTSITSKQDCEKLYGTENPRVEWFGRLPADADYIHGIIRSRTRNK